MSARFLCIVYFPACHFSSADVSSRSQRWTHHPNCSVELAQPSACGWHLAVDSRHMHRGSISASSDWMASIEYVEHNRYNRPLDSINLCGFNRCQHDSQRFQRCAGEHGAQVGRGHRARSRMRHQVGHRRYHPCAMSALRRGNKADQAPEFQKPKMKGDCKKQRTFVFTFGRMCRERLPAQGNRHIWFCLNASPFPLPRIPPRTGQRYVHRIIKKRLGLRNDLVDVSHDDGPL